LSSLPLLRGNLSLQRVSRSKLQQHNRTHTCSRHSAFSALPAFDINATTFCSLSLSLSLSLFSFAFSLL
jgi:hypothetical protein